MKRIRRLLYPKSAKGSWMPVIGGLILIASAAFAMAVVPQARQGLAERQQPRAVESNPYENWLNGPVSYIINPREREAFEKLTTDEERDMFIQQFWERRNPNPGSRKNAFKEEIYRRVRFADAHFGVGYPGWKSDRGHMYIMYGPPDEIHYYPNAKPYPYAGWIYRLIPGIGENVSFTFIDKAGEGDYRLAPGVPFKKP